MRACHSSSLTGGSGEPVGTVLLFKGMCAGGFALLLAVHLRSGTAQACARLNSQALGLIIPLPLSGRADEVIE